MLHFDIHSFPFSISSIKNPMLNLTCIFISNTCFTQKMRKIKQSILMHFSFSFIFLKLLNNLQSLETLDASKHVQ